MNEHVGPHDTFLHHQYSLNRILTSESNFDQKLEVGRLFFCSRVEDPLGNYLGSYDPDMYAFWHQKETNILTSGAAALGSAFREQGGERGP